MYFRFNMFLYPFTMFFNLKNNIAGNSIKLALIILEKNFRYFVYSNNYTIDIKPVLTILCIWECHLDISTGLCWMLSASWWSFDGSNTEFKMVVEEIQINLKV